MTALPSSTACTRVKSASFTIALKLPRHRAVPHFGTVMAAQYNGFRSVFWKVCALTCAPRTVRSPSAVTMSRTCRFEYNPVAINSKAR